MAKPLEHPITIIAISVAAFLLIISLRQTSQKSQQSTSEVSVLEEKAYNLSKEVQDLQTELEHSKSPEYKEKIIRDQLLLQKEGEYIVQLTAPETPSSDTEITEEQPRSNQDKWLEILF